MKDITNAGALRILHKRMVPESGSFGFACIS